jgi:hypothetical protein
MSMERIRGIFQEQSGVIMYMPFNLMSWCSVQKLYMCASSSANLITETPPTPMLMHSVLSHADPQMPCPTVIDLGVESGSQEAA